MQNYELTLTCPVATSFRCTKAANSLDIDQRKKAEHRFIVAADLDTPYTLGVIVGASGSGKTTLARYIWGEEALTTALDLARPVIDQFPEGMAYDEIAAALCGVGLTAVPCWIRPAHTLSTGQRARAECALQMARGDAVIVIDEWTSVVDRTVAKVMSHCIAKHARTRRKRIVLASCHYDVIEWLNPDWIIDCNRQEYTDRRLLWRDGARSERLRFEIRETTSHTWRFFSRYHYLSEKLACGINLFFGLWCGADQVGFLAFSNYVPHRHTKSAAKMQLHFNRLVVHPDYCGFGLGRLFLNECAAIVAARGFSVMGKFSSTPVFHALSKDPKWQLRDTYTQHATQTGPNMVRKKGFRLDVKVFSFRFIGESRHDRKVLPDQPVAAAEISGATP